MAAAQHLVEQLGDVVGTDGGASFVRESLGIPMSGLPALTYTTNVIFRCPDLDKLHDQIAVNVHDHEEEAVLDPEIQPRDAHNVSAQERV